MRTVSKRLILVALLASMLTVPLIARYLNDARHRFAAIPGVVRQQMVQADYSAAEARCPRGLPIARLMGEALEDLA